MRRAMQINVVVLAAVLALSACSDDTSEVTDGAVSTPDQGMDAAIPDGPAPDLLQPDLTPPDMPLPTCTDKSRNGDETDVDCGGATCPKCADGNKCVKAADCTSGVCTAGVCAAASCTDKVKNADETDVDCGGAKCPKCADNKKCSKAADCTSGVCDPTTGLCLAPTCTDQVQNGDETDVDCGGTTCAKCADLKKCKSALDCVSGVCDAKTGLCVAASCTDKVQNGDETDVDCGGPSCPKCVDTRGCKGNSDCVSGVCLNNMCQKPTCTDLTKNGDETDVDCGGSTCGKCADTKGCKGNGDCVSGVCLNNVCQKPSCTDLTQNGDETDVDCGGATCAKCADKKKCKAATDCLSGVCDAVTSLCAAASCTDKVQNGDESDVDCGGATCPACGDAKKCKNSSDCSSGVCLNNSCQKPSCTDKTHNGDETDVDCGGAVCAKCADKKMCKAAADCLSGVCDAISGKCAAPSCTDKVQNGGETDVDCGGSCPACADGKKCSKGADCSSGVCDAASGLCKAPSCTDKLKNGDETDVDCGGSKCSKCASGAACKYSTDCEKGICEANKCRLPKSCGELHKAQTTLPSGTYQVLPDSAGAIAVTCEMTAHGGGWTLIGSVVNGVARKWNSVAAFTGATTHGTAAAAKTNNYKSAAWSRVPGDDLRIETSQYAFGFNKLLGASAFGPYIKANWPATCKSGWIRSGADFSSGLTSAIQKTMNFTLRARDTNASCYPAGNENSAVTFVAADCCWVGGLGNNPGSTGWRSHDLSLLSLSRYKTATCSKSTYPCNANSSVFTYASFCYEVSCKPKYALVYVR